MTTRSKQDMLCMDIAHSGRSVTGFEFDIELTGQVSRAVILQLSSFKLGSVNCD